MAANENEKVFNKIWGALLLKVTALLINIFNIETFKPNDFQNKQTYESISKTNGPKTKKHRKHNKIE